MDAPSTFEIFLSAAPGLEPVLLAEAQERGFGPASAVPGGVTFQGGWPEVWRANLELRGATRVLARIGAFRALHLAQLDKRARRFPWATVLRPDVPVRVEVTARASRIYHAGAARERIERAIREELGAPLADEARVVVKVRIEDDLCQLSLDTSGESLHRRGYKQAVAKAPMRETLAALFLRACGFDGTEPVLDPMCGSGTFVIEAAEIAAGLAPGRARSFAFEDLANFDPAAWEALRAAPRPAPGAGIAMLGSDRDQGAVRMSVANAARAGVAERTRFECRPVADLERPAGPPGLVIVNPPYGARIGAPGPLRGLHASLGAALRERFGGWRVGLVTSDPGLARATGLPFAPPGPPVAHGGLKVRLFRTPPLG
ncbi:THUMP domain-containing class I SAM-dependent RNA methyltransferase [Amaricoccus solimangrovi]|uniref:Class I SAM-dependent RNA methyltransferase n=1 Tax=Amaricoccus solimangrovi TaxID=2589815 RepID=A0A501WHC0_9RHOB|nr:class I SAM-dependent RNA methyltransferase [Amaricoccus solimangrovi]TPE48939.1 class I SAM-dependent RNA methyltransferase [Amaricoccus solimangrovi]